MTSGRLWRVTISKQESRESILYRSLSGFLESLLDCSNCSLSQSIGGRVVRCRGLMDDTIPLEKRLKLLAHKIGSIVRY